MLFIPKKEVYVYAKMRLDLRNLRKEIIPILKKKIAPIEHLISFREYQEDKEIFLHIYNRSFLVSPDPFRSVSMDDLDDLKLDIFLIKLYGKETGEISIDTEVRDGEKIGIITSLAVLPEKRRMGLGSALALRAYEFLKNNKINIIECKVGEENKPSYTFIKFIGFKKYDEEAVELKS